MPLYKITRTRSIREVCYVDTVSAECAHQRAEKNDPEEIRWEPPVSSERMEVNTVAPCSERRER